MAWLWDDFQSHNGSADYLFSSHSALHDGLTRTPSGLSDLAHVMNANLTAVIFNKLPAAVPNLLGHQAGRSIRTDRSGNRRVGGLIAGMGYLMLLANGSVKTDLMFAALFTLGFCQ